MLMHFSPPSFVAVRLHGYCSAWTAAIVKGPLPWPKVAYKSTALLVYKGLLIYQFTYTKAYGNKSIPTRQRPSAIAKPTTS